MKYILVLFFVLAVYNVNGQRVALDTLQTNKGSLIIQPIQHASLVLSVNGITIYADPTGGTKNYKGIAAPDIILITDIHGDHFDIKTIDSIKTAATMLIVPQVVADKLPDADKTHLVILKNGDNTVQSAISIMAIPMYNLPEIHKAFRKCVLLKILMWLSFA